MHPVHRLQLCIKIFPKGTSEIISAMVTHQQYDISEQNLVTVPASTSLQASQDNVYPKVFQYTVFRAAVTTTEQSFCDWFS
jgi:hypothetical protein